MCVCVFFCTRWAIKRRQLVFIHIFVMNQWILNVFSLLDLGENGTRKGMNLIHLTWLMLLHNLVKVETTLKKNNTIGYYQTKWHEMYHNFINKHGMCPSACVQLNQNICPSALNLLTWNSICCQPLRECQETHSRSSRTVLQHTGLQRRSNW